LDILIYQPSPNIKANLTFEEKQFLSQHPTLRIHNEQGWAPYNYFENGLPKGYSIDYMKLLAKKMGVDLEFITGPSWSEFIEMIKNKEIDIMLNIARTFEREKFINFTNSYLDLAQALFIRDDMEDIHSIEQLFGKRFAIPKGFFHEETMKKYPRIQLVQVKDTADSVQAVAFNKADALQDLIPVVNYYKRKFGITNVKLGGKLGVNEGDPIPLHLGIRKDWPVLVSIINKSMQKISDEELLKIQNKWINFTEQHTKRTKINLTNEEESWINSHPVIRVHNELNWPPFNFNNKGIPAGFSIDYMNLLANRIGINVEYVSGEWGELLQNAFDKKLDILLNIVRTPDREKRLLYTGSYISNPNVIITKHDSPVSSVQSLFGKKVAYGKGFFYDEILRKKFPQIIRIEVKDALDALKAVQFGQADAALSELAVANYLIKANLLPGLAIKGAFDSGDPEIEKLNIAVRNDWPELQSILQKAMHSIKNDELNVLQRKWLDLKKDTSLNDLSGTASDKRRSFKMITRQIIIQTCLFILLVTLVMGLLYFLTQRYFSSTFSALLESNKATLIGPIMIFVFLIIIVYITQISLNTIEEQTRSNAGDSLQTINNSTHESLSVWIKNHKSSIRQLAGDPQLIQFTRNHLTRSIRKKTFIRSYSLKEIRQFFSSKQDKSGDIDFYVIRHDNSNIASKNDTDIWNKNIIAVQHPKLLQQVFSGETVFIPLIHGDKEFKSEIKPSAARTPSAFFATPIRNHEGNVMAVLAVGIDLAFDFTRLLQAGSLGTSGETYAFNKKAQLISDSRFLNQLNEIGLVSKNQKDNFNVILKDPGGNLIEGHSPLMMNAAQPLTEMAQSAVAGNSGSNIIGYRDYRGVMVLGAWMWDDTLGFGMATEIDEQEALSPFYTTRIIIIAVLGMAVFLSVLLTTISIWLGRRGNRILLKSKKELEQKVSERTAELSNRENILWDLYENAPVAYASLNPGDLGFNKHNKSFAELLAFERQDFGTLVLSQLFPKDGMDRFVTQKIKDAVEKRTSVVNFEVLLQKKDNSVINVILSTSPVFDDDGKAVEIRLTVIDITERKKAEIALSEAKSATDQRAVDLQKEVAERKKIEETLRRNMDILERFRTMSVDREMQMITLKEEINQLLKQAGSETKYKIVTKDSIA